MLLEHFMRAAASRTFCTAGSSRPIRIAIIAITTSNSISVKARRERGIAGLLLLVGRLGDAHLLQPRCRDRFRRFSGHSARAVVGGGRRVTTSGHAVTTAPVG